jgi:hypothetical protein
VADWAQRGALERTCAGCGTTIIASPPTLAIVAARGWSLYCKPCSYTVPTEGKGVAVVNGQGLDGDALSDVIDQVVRRLAAPNN